MVDSLNATTLNSTAVLVSWSPVKNHYADHYLFHYYSKPAEDEMNVINSADHEQEIKLPIHASSTTVTQLQEGLDYVFVLAVVIKVNGNYYQGNRTEVVLSGIPSH